MKLGYYDYKHNQQSFCHGQKDARILVVNGSIWRLRGRNVLSATLVHFLDHDDAWDAAVGMKRQGTKVSSLTWSLQKPEGIPILPGPTEWDLKTPQETWATGERGRLHRKALRDYQIVTVTLEEALEVFNDWVSWASERHFMVFKGHYHRWIVDHFSAQGVFETSLVGIAKDGKLLAVFGAEKHPTDDEWNVVVAKHRKEIKGRDMWYRGISAICPSTKLVRLSSTADQLKMQLGADAVPSWKFDFSKLET